MDSRTDSGAESGALSEIGAESDSGANSGTDSGINSGGISRAVPGAIPGETGAAISGEADEAIAPPGISIYYGDVAARAWLDQYRGQAWQLAIALAFTETALIPGISAAGKTAGDRRFTAHADAEFLYDGLTPPSHRRSAASYALPPLTAGLSPVLISRALLEATGSQAQLINAGLADPLGVEALDLGQSAARCLSTGRAMTRQQVQRSFDQGLALGERWPAVEVGGFVAGWPEQSPSMEAQSRQLPQYAVLGECVVGGTTTALGLLVGLGVDALGRVNSSHGHCNHGQKARWVAQGLARSGLMPSGSEGSGSEGSGPEGLDPLQVQERDWLELERWRSRNLDPLAVVAAVGDPMQPLLAGYALALSRRRGVLLAGGTQMLAVYALAVAMAQHQGIAWRAGNIAIGTTRWVAADPTGDTPGLAAAIEERFGQAPLLLATDLSFSQSQHPGLRAYEQGFVKEGVAAGGCAIATSLSLGWSAAAVAHAVEEFVSRYGQWRCG